VKRFTPAWALGAFSAHAPMSATATSTAKTNTIAILRLFVHRFIAVVSLNDIPLSYRPSGPERNLSKNAKQSIND
jgi:hypothetical protein